MQKKLISCILIVAMLLSCATFSAIAESAEATVAVKVVTGLKIVPEVEDYDAPVTRGVFASVALRLYDEEIAAEFDEGSDTPFADVTKDHYKSTDILNAYNKGIMKGTGDGNFYPEKNIQLAQVLKVVMDLLGYDVYIEHHGGYPVGYVNQAVFAGITDGVSLAYSEAVTYKDLCQIIYNALDKPMVIAETYTEKNTLYVKNLASTFLAKYHNIFKSEGVVTANSVTKINAKSGLGTNQIEIDGVVYVKDTNEYDTLVGYNTEYYYEVKSGDRYLCCAVPVNNTELVLTGSEITSYGTNKIMYKKSKGTATDVNFEANGNIIYNGIYLCKVINYDFSSLVGFNGKVRFIDTDRDNAYDTLFVTEYVNYVVDKVILSEDMIFLKGSRNFLELTEKTSYSLLKDGKSIKLNDIPNGSFVSVAVSKDFFTTQDKRCLEFVVSGEAIEGSVYSLAQDKIILATKDGKNTVYTEYKLSSDFFGEDNAALSLSSSGYFYLDAIGEIAYFSQSASGAMVYGYIISSDSGTGIKKAYTLKLMNAAGEIDYYPVADRVTMDGAKMNVSGVDSYLLGTSTVPGQVKQLVRYRFNKDGEIAAIDTSAANSDGDSQAIEKKEISSSGMSYSNKTFKISGSIQRYILPDDVKVFVVPTAADASDEDYLVRSATYFTDSKTYGAESSGQKLIMYDIYKASPKAIEFQTTSVNFGLRGVNIYSGDLGVVEKTRLGTDEFGEEYLLIDAVFESSRKTLKAPLSTSKLMRFIDGSASEATLLGPDNVTPLSFKTDLNFGDCILTSEDDNGLTQAVLKTNPYNILETSENGPKYYGDVSQWYQLTWGSVRDLEDKIMLLDVSNPEGDLYMSVSGGIQWYLVDSESESVSKASINDIIYSEYDEYADKIFMRVKNGGIQQIVIFR